MKQSESIIFQQQDSFFKDKEFIRQFNLLLFFIILLLSTILISHIQKMQHIQKISRLSLDKNTHIIQNTHAQPVVLSAKTIRVPVLMYHYVENVTDLNDTFRMSMNIPPNIFEKQITTLQSAGYQFITMQDFVNMKESNTVPEKAIILTFDDGYKDFYDVVFPIIKKHGVKVVAYISPALLDTPNYMSSNDVIEIGESGIVEIASHTMHHINLQGAALPIAYYEIFESKRILEIVIGKTVVSFAYPYGGFDDQSVNLVKKAGYLSAVTVIPGIEKTYENMFIISRIRPGMRVDQELLTYLQQDTFIAY